MATVESLTANNRGKKIHDVSVIASQVVITRIGLEDNGISIRKVPICLPDQARRIAVFVSRAKGGFAQSIKNPDLKNKHQERDLINKVSPAFSISKDVRLKEAENMLPDYCHALATLRYLGDLHRVDFLGFETIPANIASELTQVATYWTEPDTPDHIWAHLDNLDELTRRSLYGQGTVGVRSLIRLGHYFVASSHISEVFNL